MTILSQWIVWRVTCVITAMRELTNCLSRVATMTWSHAMYSCILRKVCVAIEKPTEYFSSRFSVVIFEIYPRIGRGEFTAPLIVMKAPHRLPTEGYIVGAECGSHNLVSARNVNFLLSSNGKLLGVARFF